MGSRFIQTLLLLGTSPPRTYPAPHESVGSPLPTPATATVACGRHTTLLREPAPGARSSLPALPFPQEGCCCRCGRAKGPERSPWRPGPLPILQTREKGLWLLVTTIWTLVMSKVLCQHDRLTVWEKTKDKNPSALRFDSAALSFLILFHGR